MSKSNKFFDDGVPIRKKKSKHKSRSRRREEDQIFKRNLSKWLNDCDESEHTFNIDDGSYNK